MAWEEDPGWKYLRLSTDEMLAEQSKPFNAKTAIWVPDKEEGFLLGEIKGEKGDQVTVFVKGAEQTYKKDQLQEVNPPKFNKCEDISTMSYLNEASVLFNLRDRYASMLIYTYSGLFCVVINPYKRLPIYTDSVARIYMGKRKNEIPPHLFAASDEAYRNMMQDNQCQSMLITGESGAGKTENTKKVISYFASVGAKQAEDLGIKKEGKQGPTLEDQIVQTNPVLEAFGNAKTVRNNNSSRFGKFIRIHFNKEGRVAACDIEHYLLEKSRVIRQAPGERAYHIFYQIMSGYNPDLKNKLQIDKEPVDYWYVNQAETTIPGVDDKEEFALTDEAFDILNFSADEKFNVYRLCSAMLHMGEMAFKQRGEQAEPDGKEEAGRAAGMFGVQPDALLTAFCKPRVKVGNEWVNKGQTAEQVNWSKGAMAKAIFDRLFDWLVMMCNKTLDASDLQRVFFVGVLDIAGFEIFDFNSFEQLWINFVNEKLQQFFNHHMFVLEQEEYQKEGIQWEFIDFGMDLAACIELLEKPMGIISSLDEECVVPKGSDSSYAQKLNENYLGKHPKFEKPKPPKGKQAEAHFALIQYAGTVRYNVTNWLEKNKDPLNDTVAGVLKASLDNELIKTIWADYQTQEERAAAEKAGGGGGKGKKGKSASMMTVSMKYRTSLDKLMTMLHSTHPHFIRCLIPNELKKSGLLAAELVMNQLTCNGVLEGIRICRLGLPNRIKHDDFRQRYAILAAEAAKGEPNKKTSTEMMAKVVSTGRLSDDEFRLGDTKVFFKAGVLAKMEELREEKLSSLLKLLQAEIRWWTATSGLPKKKAYVQAQLILKNNVRSWTQLRTWDWFKLLGKVKGMFETIREMERMAAVEGLLKEAQEKLANQEATKAALNAAIEESRAAKEATLKELDETCGGFREAEMKISELVEQRVKLAEDLEDLTKRLSRAEDENAEMNRASSNMEGETANFKRKIADFERSVKALEKSNKERDTQISALEAETSSNADALEKLKKEVAGLDEQNNALNSNYRSLEEKVESLGKEKSDLEKRLSQAEDGMKREKRDKSDVDAGRRKAETELMLVMQKIEELLRAQSDWDLSLKRKGQELQTLEGYLLDERNQSARLQEQIANISKAVRVKF